MSPDSLQDLVAVIDAAEAWVAADPLRFFKFKSFAQRKLAQMVSLAEVNWRSGNQGGKTYGGAALGVALARGVRSLDGVALPVLRSPNVGWVLTKTYKQQVDSVQQAYLQVIGNHPHHIAYLQRNMNYIGAIYIKPDGCTSDHYQDWSRIVFHCEGHGKSLPGGRVDWVHADEPPKPERWREVRARGRRNSRFVRYITATPLAMPDWQWMEHDFRLAKDKVWKGRYEIQSSVYDNTALSAKHIAKLEEAYNGDPLFRARMEGEYIDAAGDPAFKGQWDTLMLWLKRVRQPELKHYVIQTEMTYRDGRHIIEKGVDLQVFHPPEFNEEYYLFVDPSEGIEDPMHDPGGILVGAIHQPKVCAIYNGYLSSYGLGSLSGYVGSDYNMATIDPETNAWCEGVFRSLSDMGYHKLAMEVSDVKMGKVEGRLGFRLNRYNRADYVTAAQHVLEHDSILCESEVITRALMNTTVDRNGKVLAAPGKHDEFLILLGRYAMQRERVAPNLRPWGKQEEFAERVNRDFGRMVIPTAQSRQKERLAQMLRGRSRFRARQ
jgi:hypothetical protein